MINIAIDNANPELVEKVEARTKELGFTTVTADENGDDNGNT